MPFDQVAVAGVAPQRRAHVRRSARRTTWPRTSCARYTEVRGAPPAQPVVRAVPCRPRRRDPRAPARPRRSSSWRASASCIGAISTQVQEYRALVAERDALRRNRGDGRRVTEAMEALRPGDVVVVRRRGGRVGGAQARAPARRRQPAGRGRARARRRAARAPDFDGPPRRAATIDLPVPFAPRNPAFRRRPRNACAGSSSTTTAARSRREERRRPSSTQALGDHPLAATRSSSRSSGPRPRSSGSNATCSAPSGGCAAAARAWPGSSTGCCACSSRGATSTAGSSPTPASCSPASTPSPTCSSPRRCAPGCSTACGRRARRASSRCFTYERRGPEGTHPMPPVRWPTKTVAKRGRESSGSGEDLRANEDDAGLPETRPPDPGLLAATCTTGRRGSRSPTCSTTTRLTGGDFVRHVKQVHRPAPPGRRRRARSRDRAHAPARPPTPASAASSPRRASRPAEDRARGREGPAVGAPGGGPGRVARERRRRHPRRRGAATDPGALVEFRPGRRLRSRPGGRAPDRRRRAAGARRWSSSRRAAGRRRRRDHFAVNVVVLGVAPDRAAWLTPSPAAPGAGRRAGRPRRPRDRRGGRQRPVPRRPRRRPAGSSRRRSGRGAGLRARPAGAGRRCAPRLPQGVHLPHPDITQTTGRHVEIRAERGALPLEIDGVPAPPAAARDRRRRPRGVPARGLSDFFAVVPVGRGSRRYHRQPAGTPVRWRRDCWACTPPSTSPPTRRPSSARTSRTSTVRCSRS